MAQPIESIQGLAARRDKLVDVIAQRRRTYDRIGVAADVSIMPRSLGEDSSETNVNALVRVGRAREVVTGSIIRTTEELRVVDGQLRASAPAYLEELAQQQQRLARMQDLVSRGFLPEAEGAGITVFERQVQEFATLPERLEPLREGIEELRRQQQEQAAELPVAGVDRPSRRGRVRHVQKRLAATEKPTVDDATFTIPTTGTVVTGDVARLLAALAGAPEGTRITASQIAETAGLRSYNVYRLVRQAGAVSGVEITAIRGQQGGYFVEFPATEAPPKAVNVNRRPRGQAEPQVQASFEHVDPALDSRLRGLFMSIVSGASDRNVDLGKPLTDEDMSALGIREEAIEKARQMGLGSRVKGNGGVTFTVEDLAVLHYLKIYGDTIDNASRTQRAGLRRELIERVRTLSNIT